MRAEHVARYRKVAAGQRVSRPNERSWHGVAVVVAVTQPQLNLAKVRPAALEQRHEQSAVAVAVRVKPLGAVKIA